MMKKKILILFLFATSLLFSLMPTSPKVVASSSTTYTYALDDDGYFVQTQDAYLPGQTITYLGLDKPSDIAVDNQNRLVIADTGNERIVVYNPRTGLVDYEFTYPDFVAPTGVYVVLEESTYVGLGDIYVSDPVAGYIFHFDALGNLVEKFGKPDSIMYETILFEPQKVAVDKAGIMYIISKGTSDGIVKLSNEGNFLGFFSSNKVTLTLREQFQQFIYTDEQLDNLGLIFTPPVFSSVYIDDDGIVYSSSSGIRVENIKKHNTQGTNMFQDMFVATETIADLYVDNQGMIYTADQKGYISVYTNEGEFVYIFGSISDVSVAGFFKTLVGIAVDQDGQIWTVDSGNNYIQSFVPTEYATKIYQAINLYNETKYDEAIDLWTTVLSLNQLSVLAHNGIAKNYLQIEEYDLAAFHFKIAGNRTLYSEAYWEIRNIWLQEYLILMIGLFALATIGYYVIKATNKKYHYLQPITNQIDKVKQVKVIHDVLYMKEVIKKPSDSFYYLKRKRHGSYLGATIILVLTFFSYLLFVAGKGFIFQMTSINDLDLSSIILGFVILIGLFILCQYLVTSIQDGEGTLGEIYKGVSYSMYPFILACIASTLFSYVATNNEVFILNVIFLFGLGYSILLVFISIAEIQNYTFGQTIKSILLTILFVVIILLVLAFIQMTLRQVWSFLEEIIKEAIRNVFS